MAGSSPAASGWRRTNLHVTAAASHFRAPHDEVQPGVVGIDHAVVQGDLVVLRGDQVRVEEREADLVAGAVDDRVDLFDGAVDEPHPVAVPALHIRLDGDVAVAEPVEQIRRDRRVRREDPVIRLRQAVVGHPPLGDAEQRA
jgi:hypothetical protein